MKLLTAKILRGFEKQGDTENMAAENVKIIVKYFNPQGAGTWYAVEYDQASGRFFGFVSILGGDCDELGYFTLEEIQHYRGRLGLGIERDMYFGNHNLQEVLDGGRP